MASGHLKPRKNKDGSTSYQITIELDRDPITGKRKRHYVTVNGTKKQAQIELRRLLTEYESGNIVNPSTMPLKAWVTQWLNDYNPNIEDTTRDSYEEKIRNHIAPNIGTIPLKSLNAMAIQSWINDMKKRGLSSKTIRNTFNILNPALKKALEMQMIKSNPCESAVLPKLQKPKITVYDTAQIKQVLSTAKGTDIYIMVLLGLSLGLRRGEICALKWSHINWDSKTIKIDENRVHAKKSVKEKAPKTDAGTREITVGDDVLAELQKANSEYRQKAKAVGFHDLDYVIYKEDGKPYHPDSLTQKWTRFTKKNKLPHIKLHGTRHTNATAMIQAGVSAKVVQERLGHSDVGTTMRYYVHTLPSMNQEAAEKLDSILFA